MLRLMPRTSAYTSRWQQPEMNKTIRKYYLIQLGISFLICVTTVNMIGLINEIDKYSRGRLILLSMVGALLFLILNALINSLNFTFNRTKNEFMAFYLPILIWCIAIAYVIARLKEDTFITDLIMLIIWIEPIVYNLKLKKAAANTMQ